MPLYFFRTTCPVVKQVLRLNGKTRENGHELEIPLGCCSSFCDVDASVCSACHLQYAVLQPRAPQHQLSGLQRWQLSPVRCKFGDSQWIKPEDFSLAGYAFQLGKNYSIEISLIQTKEGTANASNVNLPAIARSYADFTPIDGNAPVVNLPVVLEDGAFKFDITVVPGQTYFIDPEIAIGYDYATALGDPRFLSVDLPDTIGDGLYDIDGFDLADQLVLAAAGGRGGDVFSFGPDGVDRFRVLGIETSAGLDPNSTTAFVTGLTFDRAGRFTGTQKPITVQVNDIPEPSTLSLVALAALALIRQRRRDKPNGAR